MPSILFATNSDKLSGGNRQLALAANALAASGHTVTVIAPTGRKLGGTLDAAVACIPSGPRLGLLQARRILAHTQPDVVHCFHSRVYKAFLFAKLLGARFRLFLNRGVVFVPGSFPLFFLPQLDGIICNSEAAATVLRRLWIPQRKIHRVPNAIAMPEGCPNPATRPSPPWVTFVGGTKPYKGLDIFLRAMASLARRRRDFAVHVVGTHADSRWEALLGPAVERTCFHGAVAHAEVLRVLSATSIFVLASRQESQPNALLEAMACGAAPVATAVGGVPEILTHGRDGILTTPEDPEAIAQAVGRLLDVPSERLLLATAAQRRAGDFSVPTRTARLLAIYGLDGGEE
ncbi:glycosyl transferase [Thermodesulfomicrobium sp. WS]|uniref:glycosyltransferase family 4 protein n=1 Tax=Thermodesulfomicrobium sp. WS TaxID=3004129 RepID=UPI002490D377|nr:glycosyltransferase family 4 protein [Thermodesulfomicrobium sp. WS]BDV01056.1 glycosyl transferase [Thermodesulfomicrobium sp. WS]